MKSSIIQIMEGFNSANVKPKFDVKISTLTMVNTRMILQDFLVVPTQIEEMKIKGICIKDQREALLHHRMAKMMK